MLRIAVCDDDVDFLEKFKRILTVSFADAGQQAKVFTFSDGKSLIAKVEKEKQIFDIIFLDVQMPEVNGFQVAQRLRELNAALILVFTTYIENQSREGYLYGAFRYVFKNNLEAEISEAVSSITKKLGDSADGQEEIAFKYRNLGVLDNLTLKKGDIILLQAEKNRRVTLKTAYSEYELLTKPLSKYAEQLNAGGHCPTFFPIMRTYLLNFNHIQDIGADSFLLTGGLQVPLGVKREVRKASREKYLKFLEGRI
jgi:DNA-binding LytR/AlgR family response regulator